MKEKNLHFIKRLLLIALPIIIQQVFLNIAGLLDTMMVGKLDSASVSGVYIANQIVFVITMIIFGSTEGSSIFFSQFFGAKDKENMTKCMIFKIYSSLLFAVISMIITLTCADQLVSLFTSNPDEAAIAVKYFRLITISYIPYAIVSSISTCYRESHKSSIPMTITIIGATVNFLINFVLIFGYLGMPKLGAIGAVIGTIVERYLELIILVTILIVKRPDFATNVRKNLRINKDLVKKLVLRSIPLVVNEFFWALGQSMIVFVFTKNDPIATTVLPIATTIYNLIFVVCLGVGISISILIGNLLGEGKNEEAKEKAYLSGVFASIVGIVLCVILASVAPFIAGSYTGLDEETRLLGKYLIYIFSIYLIICSCNNAFFFIIRSGGRAVIVFLFDSVYAWVIQIPIAFLLLKFTNLPLLYFIAAVYAIDIIKFITGIGFIVSKKWIKNLTVNQETATN